MPKIDFKQPLRPNAILILFVIALDQITKVIARETLDLFVPTPVAPYLNFTLVWNTGMSFGMFSNVPGAQIWLTVLAIAICAYLLYWMTTTPHRLESRFIALIIAGALGNVIDRVIHGAVIDFIDVYYGSYHWPAFNIADSAITCGVILLVLYPLVFARKNEDKNT